MKTRGNLNRDAVPNLQHLFSELIRFETELWNAVDARLRAEDNLPLSQFEPMQIIAQHGACRVHDIAAALAITIGGTSKLIDRIEALGYCRRLANPTDGRSSLITLTPAGQELLARATRTFEDELMRRVGSALPDAALEMFSEALSQLRAAGHASPTTERSG